MNNAPDSVKAFQHAIIRMLSCLLNEDLFIPSIPSMDALRELQATLLTHGRVGVSMRHVASGGHSKHPLNTTHSPSTVSPSDPRSNPSGLTHRPPHVSGVEADDLGVGMSNPSHVTSEKAGDHMTQKTRKRSRRQRRRANAETNKETTSESLTHGADAV
jgi:hypothetical protein